MNDAPATTQPFALRPAASSAWSRAALGVAAPVLEHVLGLSALGRMYQAATGSAVVDDFPERALAYLGITWRVGDGDVASIPATGPLVIVANHPFGAADGLVLLALVRQVRRDVRLLGNYLLDRLPELGELIIPVDPFGGAGARETNRSMVRRAADWTRRGGALIVFPAGSVSSVPAADGHLVDGPWKAGVARILADSGAPVVPIFVSGRNSRLFELAGRLHPLARTALLPRELLRSRNTQVSVAVGAPIAPDVISAAGDVPFVLAYLRARTYGLRADATPQPTTTAAPVVPAVDGAAIAADVARLPPDRRLVTSRSFAVYYASAAEAPSVIREIGRLRELAFRAVGEGTGRPCDLDRFDDHYWHLFLWDEARQAVAGAYRLGATDLVSSRFSARGLYTRELFAFGRRFLASLGPALELGRSFVRIEYQREFSALLLLWQGIGRFVATHPQYRRLFGPVSISAAYRGASRDLMVDLLSRPAVASPLAPLVASRHPYARRTDAAFSPLAEDVSTVSSAIGAIEPDGKSLPVLLRQYIKLNAKVVSLSVDPNFSGVVDALVVVDLDTLDRRTLERYLGADGATQFVAHRAA
jgi:putative hemolysin